LLLLKLMAFSRVLNASALLLRIKDTALFDEQVREMCGVCFVADYPFFKVACFSLLGQHEEALRVIFTSLKSHNKATAYCVKNQEAADVNLFLILLKVYLKRVRNGELPQKVC
jgi:hypothetical protein